jgi:hypothetical protein
MNHLQPNQKYNQDTKMDNTFTNTQRKIWITFTYHSSLIHKVTSLLKHTNLNVAFQTGNIIYSWLQDRIPQNSTNSSGIYRLQCKTCNKLYVGQTGRTVIIWHLVYARYIRTNNPISAYALHILNNKHEYGSPQHTLHLMCVCDMGKLMNCWESVYIQKLQQLDILIDEHITHETNLLCMLGIVTKQIDTHSVPIWQSQ